MRELYPAIEPYLEGSLKVSDLHTIHFEESGNPQGQPIVLLHGGLVVDVQLFIGNISIQKNGG